MLNSWLMLSFLFANSSLSSYYLSPLSMIGVLPPSPPIPKSLGFTSATGEFSVPDLKGVEFVSLIAVTTGIKNVLVVFDF